jgi:cell pole-organizing protein PopZ
VADAGLPPPPPRAPASSSGFGSKTIEELMREMMGAALQEWMDKNLPEMVEKMVEREIARIARR